MATREYVGAGGIRLHLDDPLSPQMAEQLAKGQLRLAPEEADDVQETPDADSGAPSGAGDSGEVERPAKNAPVADWRAYAVALGMSEDEAAAATKTECQEFTQVVEDARQAGE